MNKGNIYLLDNIKQEPSSQSSLINSSKISYKLETGNDIKKEPTETTISIKPNESNEAINLFVNNVVCSYSTRCHLNLRRIAMEGMHVEYKKENGMVNMKLRKPYTTATIWSSGKVTCAGAKTEKDAYIAARRYCRLLQRMQFKVKMTNYRVVNVLATCNMPFAIDISKLAEKYQKECSYEPELHPGATYKIKDLKATLKLFTTGSITLTSPSVQIAQQAVSRIYPVLVEFKRNFSTNNSNLTPAQNQQPKQSITTIKLQNNFKLAESITTNNLTNTQPWLYQSKTIESLTPTNTHKYNQSPSLYAPIIPQASSHLYHHHHHHHHLHTTFSEPLLYSASLGTSSSPSILTNTTSFTNSLPTQQQAQITQPSFLSVTTTNGTSTGSIFSPTNHSSSSLYSSTGSSQSQAPSHWFYDNLLIDNNVDDFLP